MSKAKSEALEKKKKMEVGTTNECGKCGSKKHATKHHGKFPEGSKKETEGEKEERKTEKDEAKED